MKKFLKLIAFLVLLFIVAYHIGIEQNEEIRADVYIIDGDTFVINGEKIRVIGIDTMEYGHSQKSYVIKKLGIKNVSCLDYYGKKAFFFTKELLENPNMRIELTPVKRDRYNRLLAYVTLCNSSGCFDYGELVLERGLAIVYDYEKFEKKDEYREIQKRAKESGLRLWSCY